MRRFAPLVLASLIAAAGVEQAVAGGEMPSRPKITGDCLTCHAKAERDGLGPVVAAPGGRQDDPGYRFCDGPLILGPVSGQRAGRAAGGEAIAFLRRLAAR